jgi:hypothetical protein
MIKCFWAEPSDFCRVRLRRYRYNSETPCVVTAGGRDSCESSVVIHDHALRSAWIEDLPNGTQRNRDELVSEDSPQWPDRCEACGIAFGEDSVKQVWAETLYIGAPDARPFVLRSAPAGAMWDCRWWPAHNPDGISLRIMLPDGVDWLVDDGRWTRTGDPRTGKVSVQPSIRSPRYHGILTDGWLKAEPDSQIQL